MRLKEGLLSLFSCLDEIKNTFTLQYFTFIFILTKKELCSIDKGLVCLVLNIPVNNFSVMLRRSNRFLGITSTLGGGKYVLLKDTARRP